MKKSRFFREAVSLALCLAVIAAAWITGILNKQKTWGTMEYLNMTFIEQDPSAPTYGVQNSGPKFDLPEGNYRLKFSVDTDGAGVIRLKSFNSAEITPCEFPFAAGDGEQIVSFHIDGGSKKFEVLVDFESGTYFHMGETRLYSPEYRDHVFTLAFVTLGAWLLAVLWGRGKLTPRVRGILLLLAAAVVIASVPAFKENLCVYHDTKYHSARLRNLAEGLAEGMFPVRLGGYSYNGFGAVTSVFYPDVFLYPFALILNAGASLQYVMNLYAVCMNLLTAGTMYLCAARIAGDPWTGVCASVLYLLAPYRITGMWVRWAMGEFTAMAVMPVFLLGLWEVLRGDRERWPILAVGAAAVFCCHMISTFLCALLACLLCVLNLLRLFREKRFSRLVFAAVCTVGLCLWDLIPLVQYSLQGIGADSLFTTTMAGTAVSPAQLFLLGEGDMAEIPQDTTLSFMPLEIGLPLLLGAVLILFAAVTREDKEKDERLGACLQFILAAACFAVCATTLFPWNYAAKVTKLFDCMQFAWRFLTVPALLLPIPAACGLMQLSEEKRLPVIAGTLALCTVLILPTLSVQTRRDKVYEYGQDGTPDIKDFGEYCLPGVDTFISLDREIRGDGVQITDAAKHGTRVTAHIESAEGGEISLPMFAFDGYRAEIAGVSAETVREENGRLGVRVPAGTSGTLTVRFAGKKIWRLGETISLLTALALGAGCLAKKKKRA